jgi:hypothetical protein
VKTQSRRLQRLLGLLVSASGLLILMGQLMERLLR